MSYLPRVSGREVAKAMRKLGYQLDRQRGSHLLLAQTAPPFRHLTIPDHRGLPTGTVRAIIREAGLTVDEFKALL